MASKSYFYITVKSVCVCVCVFPHFFEPNQNGHNSINFKAITSRFCMVVDLEEDDEDRLRRTMMTRMTRTTTTRMTTTMMTTTTIFFVERSEAKDAERSEANPCGAASFAKPR